VGNPHYLSNILHKYDYTEDISIPINEYIKTHTLAQNKKVIKKYIENMYKCWEWGFYDTVYNFDRNSGVDINGNVVLFDFGELTFNIWEVENHVSAQHWLEKEAYHDLPDNLKLYFKNTMKKRVTVNKLNEIWGTKLLNSIITEYLQK
jgi:hypothetical protein